MIDAYKFGEIVVQGKAYTQDVIIFPDHVDAKWWRKQGHTVEPDDIREVIDARPDTIIFGTGQPGLMEVSGETLKALYRLQIGTVIAPTEQACREYNRIARTSKVVACLHLTC